LKHTTPGDLPEKVVSHINGINKQKVFVTRDFRENDYLPNALKGLNFEVEGKSLIELKEIKINFIPRTEWVFFSSKHAVRYFFRQNPVIENVKFGCISKQTSMELRSFGKRADFIGQSTDTKLIGKQFGSLIGNARVLFPIAKESMQSIQYQLVKRDNAVNLPVYETLKHSVEVAADTTIIVFTSPSNVESFFEKNKWLPTFQAVAMGDATGSMLEKKGVKKYETPDRFDDLGLMRAIMKISV
jgi:hydroxymethylbilane synthase